MTDPSLPLRRPAAAGLATLGLLAALAAPAVADVPDLVGFHGWLTDQSGAPASAPAGLEMAFRLYHDPSGGAPFWEDTYPDVEVEDGAFFVLLGAGQNPLPTLDLDGTVKYLGIAIAGGAELQPRLQVVSVPYALRAGVAGTALFADDAGSLGGLGPDDFFKKSEVALPDLTAKVQALEAKAQQLQQTVDLLLQSPGGGCLSACTAVGEVGCTGDGTAAWTCGEAGDDDPCLEQLVEPCPGDTLCVDGACICKPAVTTACVGDSAYAFDSCGAQGALVEACGPGHCESGACFGWSLQTPVPGQPIRALYTLGNDVYAVGDGGLALHHDGVAWRRMPTPTTKDLLALWGYSNAGQDVLYAVGETGKVLRYDATGWKTVNTGWFSTLRAVHGLTAVDIWAAGDDGTVLHYDGGGWTRTAWEPGAAWESASFRAVWAATAKVWVGGAPGVILQHDGAWAPQELPAGAGTVRGFWGFSEQSVWAAATGADNALVSSVLQLKGSWVGLPLPSDVTGPLASIWGNKNGDNPTLLAVGPGGAAWESDGFAWVKSSVVADRLPGADLQAVRGGAALLDPLWVAASDGRVAYRESGGAWVFPSFSGAVTGLWSGGATPDATWAVGTGCLALRYDGLEWVRVTVDGCAGDLNAVRGWFSGGTGLVAVGDGGTYLTWSGTGWQAGDGPPGGEDNEDVWALGPSTVAVVRPSGTWLFNGVAWQATGGGAGREIWGASAQSLWVVDGTSAVVQRFDGSEWVSTPLSAGPLADVGGSSPSDVWVVGKDGAAFRWDGGAWVDASLPDALRPPEAKGDDLAAVWVGAGGVVVAAAGAGYVYTHDGAAWSRERTWPTVDHGSVFGLGGSDAWIGGPGTLFARD